MKIAFLIRSLELGGAERQLVTLARGLHARGHSVVVAVFYAGGPLEHELHSAGIPVRSLEKRGRWDTARFMRRLFKVIDEEQPDVLHSYLVVANVLAAALRPAFPRLRIVWGVRDAQRELPLDDWFIHVTVRMQRAFSTLPHLIIANSQAGRSHHVVSGFPSSKVIVIPNGIDSARFAPDEGARRRVREEFGITDGETVFGVVARLDPVKDHGTLLGAAAALASERRDVRFLCVGDGTIDRRGALHAQAERLGVADRVIWTGARGDMPAVMNAFDVAVSSSGSEGFPNNIAEAMSCGIPCVVTNVGDSGWIVEGSGVVVPPHDPHALALGLRQMLERRAHDGVELSQRARARIVQQFGLDALVARTARELEAIL
jgi:glycosyltransferase involved in cell wall biosynthesis